ncbi:MAG: trehalose-phosphatase [Deltaproteobacteria bacterium]|nr:trehalose-phosphatase [Deltaproteobacteria bacterium]
MNLWVFDFDGTLSDMVPDRDAATLNPSCGALLDTLSRKDGNFVAVVSSREIEDLANRVPLPDVILGGASGLSWRFPGGVRLLPGDPVEKRRDKVRKTLEPILNLLSAYPGVEVEDKGWSIAVHYRQVLPDATPMLEPLLAELGETPGTRMYRGTYAVELQLFPNVSKSFGVRRLCRLLKFDPSSDRILYAGDDENDAVAMRWVLKKGGIALSVGRRVRVRGARPIDDPAALARAVRGLAEAT